MSDLVLGPRECLTTAPEDYDYFWMETIARNVAVDRDGKAYRLARNQDDWHFKNQVARYQSGLHVVISRNDAIDDWIGRGWLIPTPEKRINVHRVAFDVGPLLASREGIPDPERRRNFDELLELIDNDANVGEASGDAFGRWDGLVARFRCEGDAARDRIVESMAAFGVATLDANDDDDDDEEDEP